MSRVNFQSAECVPPRPWSISDWQSVFRHVLVEVYRDHRSKPLGWALCTRYIESKLEGSVLVSTEFLIFNLVNN